MNEPSSTHNIAWEYRLVEMGNPLGGDVEERANGFGLQGWELAAIDAGVWIFKRSRPVEPAEQEPLRALIEQTVPIVEDVAPSTA
jgi:hypothetical protein